MSTARQGPAAYEPGAEVARVGGGGEKGFATPTPAATILTPRPENDGRPAPQRPSASSVPDLAIRINGDVELSDSKDGEGEGEGGGEGRGEGEGDGQESFADWLERYRIGGAGPSDRPPTPPADIQAVLDAEQAPPSTEPSLTSPDPESSRSSAGSNTTSNSSLPSLSALTAATLLDFYRRRGHFPAPPGPFEEERLRLAHKYGLDSPVRRKAIDRICALAKLHFKTKTVVISLTLDDHQVLGAEKGWGGEEPGLDVPPRPLTLEPAFCTHAMLAAYKDPKAVFIVGDADADWRFRKSPYTVGNGGGVGFYAAANVHLPTLQERLGLAPAATPAVPGDRRLPKSLPSGAVCLIDPSPREPSSFSADDRAALNDFADLISLEFQRGYEQRRREEEAAQSDFVGRFLRQALVLPAQPRNAEDHANGTASAPSECIYATAARELRKLTHAGSASILDLRSFKLPSRSHSVSPADELARSPLDTADLTPSDETRPSFSRASTVRARLRTKSTDAPSALSWTAATDSRGKVSVLNSAGDIDWQDLERDDRSVERLGDAVYATLTSYFVESAELPEHSRTDANAFVRCGLIDADRAGASIALPISDDDGSPVLLVVLTSGEKWFSFESVDRQFASSVGAIVVGSMLRERAVEADLAKLRFVGHVSHELRTPLHGCTSQIDLIREFASPPELRKLAPLLDAADVCLESLSDVLNDTLDFSKLTNAAQSSPSDVAAQQMRALSPADLQGLVEGVTKSVWVRKRRVELVSQDVRRKGSANSGGGQVDVLLEVGAREGGWSAMADVGGLKRCLLNIVGNSLKFTRSGKVEVALHDAGPIVRAQPHSYSPPLNHAVEKHLIVFTVTDTGIGMSEEFLRDRKYLTPFVQADPFVSGAGLGLSIVDSIVRRMGGKMEVTSKLGVGTATTISLPLDMFVNTPSAAPAAGAPIRRNISAELAQIKPAASAPTLDSMDFEGALNSTQSSLHKAAATGNIPKRPVLDRQPSERIEEETLAVDVAKLSFSDAVKEQESNAAPMHDPLTPIHERQVAFSGPEDERAKVRVLVAEDNPIGRNILVKLLSGKGIPFSATEDGQEALETYEAGGRGAYHLFLVDVQMPRLDGIGAARAVRALELERGWPRCRIIALTGLTNGADMQASSRAGSPVDSWIVKGGKSLRAILDEVQALQELLDSGGALPSAQEPCAAPPAPCDGVLSSS